ncbi:MAG: hypothetical protein ACLQF0_05325 [Dissulfurispiraceae bacterium]
MEAKKEELIDHTSGVLLALESGDTASLSTILGSSFRDPIAGIIRPGIKVLVKDATEEEHKIYSEMVAVGESFVAIEKRLGKERLRAQNVDYFTIRTNDCKARPSEVEKIYKLYADTDGKLREFPVVFRDNSWQDIIPHSLRCWSAGGLKFQSRFVPKEAGNGQVKMERVCEFPLKEAGKRSLGPVKKGQRPCAPEDCPEYQSKACRLDGLIKFFVPGITGIGIWVIHTVSWNSLVNIKSGLETVQDMTKGKLAGKFPVNGKNQPIFRLRKVEDTVNRRDPKGQVLKTDQFLINLDLDVDITDLMDYGESAAVRERGQRAIATLSGKNIRANAPSILSSAVLTEAVSDKGDRKNGNCASESQSEQVDVHVGEANKGVTSDEDSQKAPSMADKNFGQAAVAGSKEDIKAAFKKAFAAAKTKDEVNAIWRIVVENCNPVGEKLPDNLKLDGKDKADIQPAKANAIERIKGIAA